MNKDGFIIRMGNAILFIILFVPLFLSFNVRSQEISLDSLLNLSLEDLMYIEVETASGVVEKKLDAPAAVVIITKEEIVQRGYTDLAEILMDVPGFDFSLTNGTRHIIAYQRGYRTPFTQRTLLMIDGKVDNGLWDQDASISRQYPVSNIERIEVVYGPASSVYGPNAFLGIINVITRNGAEMKPNSNETTLNIQYGSYNTMSYDVATIGKTGKLNYSFSSKLFRSDDPDLSDKWGFLSNDLYSDSSIWGPILDLEHRDKKLGSYYDGAMDFGFIGHVAIDNLKFGVIAWETKEGYGPYYAADRAQNNSFWNRSSIQLYAEHSKQLSPKINNNFLVLYRENRKWGKWAEAEPDWDDSVIPNDTLLQINGSDTTYSIIENFRDYSYISYTEWNADNNAWLLKENIEYQWRKNVVFSAGMKWALKELTKAYDIPGYWDPAFSSAGTSNDLGPYGYGLGIYHSSDSLYHIPPEPSRNMPSHNLALWQDLGGYVQAIIDAGQFRFHLGVREDNNSVYGNSVNPRLAAMYRYKNSKGVTKLVYGEAFQEPAPSQLYGGWNGRRANPDLKPEKARNIEVISMYRFGMVLLDASVFYAHYDNVIKEEAENSGFRNIYGVELRSNYSFKNVIASAPKISAYAYYSFTKSYSSEYYDHQAEEWKVGKRELGDIAPHKINAGLNFPLVKGFNVNLRGNYVSNRLVYLRNALRAKDYEIDAYFTLDGTLSFHRKNAILSLKVKNILNTDHFHPGPESASSGDDFSHRSLGYQNSLIPQPGRSYLGSITFKL